MFAYGFWKMGSVAFRVQRHWLFFVVWMQLMLTAPAQAQYLSHFDVVDSFNAFWYDLFGTVEPGDLTAPVAVATDENFEALLQDSKDKTWILEFYAPWCKHCQQYAPMYEEAAERVPGLRFAKVDATAHTQVAEDYDVTGYPTLKMVRDGYVRNYRGGRNVESFAQFAHAMALPPVARISSSSQMKRFMQNNPVSFLLIRPEKAKAARAEKAYKRVAYRLQGMAMFGSVTKKVAQQSGLQWLEPEGGDKMIVVLKLDRGELPRVYDLGYDPAAIGDGEEEDDDDAEWLEPTTDLRQVIVEPLTTWVADRRFTLVSDLDSRNFFDFMQAKKLLACVVIDPLTGTGAPGAERKRWRDALLQVVRPPEFRKSLDSPGLRPDELDQYFFGIMDGTQPDVAEYLEEVGIPRWSADRLPAVVVMDFRMLGNLGYLEPRDRFYNENTATPVPAVLASLFSGVLDGSVRPRHKGLYGLPDRLWRWVADLVPLLKVANGLPQHCFIAPLGIVAFIYLLKCICCDDDYIDSDEELEQQKQQLLALTMKSRKAGLHRSRKKSAKLERQEAKLSASVKTKPD